MTFRRWSRTAIDATKSRVRANLAAIQAKEGRDGLHKHLLDSIAQFPEQDWNAADLLTHYIYLVSTLAHEIRYPSLSRTQISRILASALGILQLQGIKPGISKLSFLYGELHTALGQIARGKGQHLTSLWHQHLAQTTTRGEPLGGHAFHALSMGNRALRLGHGDIALEHFEAALRCKAPEALKERIHLQILKLLRLRGELQRANTISQHLSFSAPENQLELAWEAICRHSAASGDLTHMLLATQRKKPHHLPIYLLENRLWLRASHRKTFPRAILSLATIRRRIDNNKSREVLRLGQTLDQLYDEHIPFQTRVVALGDQLGRLNQLRAVEYALMAWLAGARWLARHNSLELARLAFSEYRALSQTLSGGRVTDSLGIAGDMMAKPWAVSRDM